MKRILPLLFAIPVLFLFGTQCTFLNEKYREHFEDPFFFDLEEIKVRGILKVALDNNSTSYYIYRGRRMGFEYELLEDLGKSIGVQVEFFVVTDINLAFDKLNKGEVDLIAMNLEPNEERSKKATFSQSLGSNNTVLVGLKPIGKPLLWEDIGSDTIFVRKNTVFKKQLENIRDSLNLSFYVLESPEHEEILIDQVNEHVIKWTVADKAIALVNKTYYEGLDVSLEVYKRGGIAWALRKNSPAFLERINSWILKKRENLIPDLYSKYFLSPRNSYYRSNSPYSSLAGNKISPFDEFIKEYSKELGWDWRLLSALVYKESGFDTTAVSYAGAEGLLQLMPVTLERFGVTNPNDPIQSLRGGVKYLLYLDKYWRERVSDTNERLKFVLASYNVGQGHVDDAWRLTQKYGKNTTSWKDVSIYLNLKSDPAFYRDQVVKSGYAKGHVTVNYVRDVLDLFYSYRTLIEP